MLFRSHGRMLSAAVAGSELVVLDEMGHDIQPHHVAPILDVMLPTMARGDRAAPGASGATE